MSFNLYQSLLRPLLFRSDPEAAHEWVLHNFGSGVLSAPLRWMLRAKCEFEDPRLHVRFAGLHFPNPVGLAAGFDKNAEAIKLFSALGFGSLELGTVTPEPQAGNPRPRIFRFPADSALINRMGFPSLGLQKVAGNLRATRESTNSSSLPILGLNIGKQKTTSVEDAAKDYLRCFQELSGLGDYFVLNVSSPNTPELRRLQEPERLRALFAAIAEENRAGIPVLVKIAPDLSTSEIESVLEVCVNSGVSGLIATNTTITRDGLSTRTEEAGGLSGAPLRLKSLTAIERIWQRTEGKLPIIGVGGISSVQHALAAIGAGASLLQLYTALIYEGPFLVRDVKRGLVRAIEAAGVSSISALVGRGVREMAELSAHVHGSSGRQINPSAGPARTVSI